MPIISCTKKLFEISKFIEEPDPKTDEELYKWHAHLFRMERKNNIILMNNKTRYSIILFGMKKEHYQKFNLIFKEIIQDNFRAEEIPEPIINDYTNKMKDPIYSKTYDRSVIGSMTEMIHLTGFRIEDYLPVQEMNIIELNKENNRTPILKLKETYPIDSLRTALRI